MAALLAPLWMAQASVGDELELPYSVGDDLALPFMGPHQEDQPVVEVEHSLANELRVGRLSILLEKTTLPEVAAMIPSGPVVHQGDAGDSATFLCYTVIGEGQRQRIWVASHGETAPDEDVVTGVSAAPLEEREKETAECPLLSDAFRPVSLADAIWLGLSRDELAAKLPGVQLPAGRFFYLAHWEPTPEVCDRCETVGWLEVEFENDRIRRLWALRTPAPPREPRDPS